MDTNSAVLTTRIEGSVAYPDPPEAALRCGPTTDQHSDRQFSRAARSASYRPGSAADFDRLYRSSYPHLKRMVTAVLGDPQTAEDVVQDAFVRAFQAWPRWIPNAPAEAWLVRIALNQAFSRRRKDKLGQLGELMRRMGRPTDPCGLPPGGLNRDDLLWALRRLPPKVCAAIVLHYYQGYRNREVARIFRVSERAIGLWLAQGRAQLQLDLGEWRPTNIGSDARCDPGPVSRGQQSGTESPSRHLTAMV